MWLEKWDQDSRVRARPSEFRFSGKDEWALADVIWPYCTFDTMSFIYGTQPIARAKPACPGAAAQRDRAWIPPQLTPVRTVVNQLTQTSRWDGHCERLAGNQGPQESPFQGGDTN